MKRLLLVLAIATAAAPAVAAPAAHAGGGGCHGGLHRDVRGAKVALTQNCFDPLVVRVAEGQRVTWTNRDAQVHTVSGASERWGSHQELTNGKSVTWKFDKAGVFPYYCDVHPGMIGAVVVGNGLSAETTTQDAGVSYIDDAAPPAAQPPVAQPQTETVAAKTDRDTGPIVAGLLALAAAVLIAAVVLLARRTPTAEPHPQL